MSGEHRALVWNRLSEDPEGEQTLRSWSKGSVSSLQLFALQEVLMPSLSCSDFFDRMTL